MEPCDYWLEQENGSQICDITGKTCSCDGWQECCTLNGKTITAAIKEEEKVTLQELSLQTRRKKTDKEAVI